MRESAILADLVKKETEEIKTDLESAKSQVRTTWAELKQKAFELLESCNADLNKLIKQTEMEQPIIDKPTSRTVDDVEISELKSEIERLTKENELNRFAVLTGMQVPINLVL